MNHAETGCASLPQIPDWVPDDVRLYLDHVEGGTPIRALARQQGVHASTILRKVRRTENRRDDPLVDKALLHLGQLTRNAAAGTDAGASDAGPDLPADEATLHRDARRILRLLLEPDTILAVVPEVDTAIVVAETADGRPRQLATVSRLVAEAMVLKEWIATASPEGRVVRYRITPEGRRTLNHLLAEAESSRAAFNQPDAGTPRRRAASGSRPRVRRRPVGAATPLHMLARHRDKAGRPYLSPEQVAAGERLRMDYELARMDHELTARWGAIMRDGAGGPDERARPLGRLRQALRFLGPELGDVALLTCCALEGMEQAEKTLAMPARSGKYVLRIALNMLLRHYEQVGADDLIY